MSVLETEFDVFFHVCKCGTVTGIDKKNKTTGNLCKSCHKETESARRIKGQRDAAEIKRLTELRAYIKTEQGRIDVVGASIIYDNIKVQMLKRNKSMKELSELLEIEQSSVTRMFTSNKSIKLEKLFKITQWLGVPFDVLVRLPRGMVHKKKNGIPVHVYKNPVKRNKDE